MGQIDLSILETLKINSKFYIGNKRFSTKIEDYSFSGFSPFYPIETSKDIMFKKDFTNFGIFLYCRKLESAVLGFNVNQSVIDCLQIQGGRRRFKQLISIAWDRALLESLILLAKKEKEIKAITIVPSFKVEGDINLMNPDKLRKRYDLNAKFFGFRYSNTEEKHILEV